MYIKSSNYKSNDFIPYLRRVQSFQGGVYEMLEGQWLR